MAPKRRVVDDESEHESSSSEPIAKIPSSKQSARKSVSKRSKDASSGEEDALLSRAKSDAAPLTAKKPRLAPTKKPSSKKPAKETPKDEPDEEMEQEASNGRVTVHTSTEGEKYVDLGKKKRATVRTFKGAVMVDIREFYGDDDDLKPGKKGISLNLDQWKALAASVGTLDKIAERMK